MFIVTVHDLSNLEKLKQAGYDAVILGIENLSIRMDRCVSLQDVQVWKDECNKFGLKLFINAVKLFMEDEMDFVKEALSVCKEEDVDGIYFSDEGLLWEAKLLGLENKCIYQPETLVANHNDVKFYLEQGVQSVSLAHELSLEEIQKIASYTSNVEVLIHGYFSICYSRRPLVKNYLDAIGSEAPIKKYDLIESTRSGRMPIVQDENGTHVYSEKPMSSIEELDVLKSAGIQRFRVDSIFKNDDWAVSVLNMYKHKLEDTEGSSHLYHQETILKKEGQ
ncbi:MAG: U32 family peptidase [Bacillota bacterium]|nr:U32 family peptidase [Bacillota bacterium]